MRNGRGRPLRARYAPVHHRCSGFFYVAQLAAGTTASKPAHNIHIHNNSNMHARPEYELICTSCTWCLVDCFDCDDGGRASCGCHRAPFCVRLHKAVTSLTHSHKYCDDKTGNLYEQFALALIAGDAAFPRRYSGWPHLGCTHISNRETRRIECFISPMSSVRHRTLN